MSPTRLGLRSQRVLSDAGFVPGVVVIEGEKIVEVATQGERPAGLDELLEFGELCVLPGLVDCHVHINQPGRTHWEGFETATRAAASGGVTTLVDMPLNCLPVTTTVPALGAKLDSLGPAQGGCLRVDVGFWGGVVPGNAADLRALAEAGVLGAKAFLCDSGIEEFPASGPDDLRAAMRVLAAAGLPLLAHAELELPLVAGEGVPGEGAADPRTHKSWLESRPAGWEQAAIELLIELCRETGCAVHIVHLSAASAIPSLRAARAEGLPVTVETCPHYLCLCAEQIPAGSTIHKCAPPIRGQENRDGLWAALAEGVIDLVVTDHSPCTPELKGLEAGDFLEAWGGIASLSLGLASVWTEARARGFALERVAGWMSRAPAQLAGLGDRKGRIAAGYDADLLVFDPDAAFTVEPERLHFRHKISPYLGRELSGVVHGTWLRGRRIYDPNGDDPFPGEASGRPLLHRCAPITTGLR